MNSPVSVTMPGVPVMPSLRPSSYCAATGDTRLQDALDLLKAGNVDEAEKRLRTVADQAQTRIREESKQAATAWRNLGAIAVKG